MGRGSNQSPGAGATARGSIEGIPEPRMLSVHSEDGFEVPITIYGDIDPRAITQLLTCAKAGSARAAAQMPDGHVGYSMPIGGVIAYEHHVSPSGAGVDIGCGVMGVRTDLQAADVEIEPIMDEITRRISFGMGRPNNEPVDHPVLDEIRAAEFTPQRALAQKAAAQLGTVGTGNHYIVLAEDEAGQLWITCHFGSRGFGHKTAAGFLALDAGLEFTDEVGDAPMDSPPVLFDIHSEIGQAYIGAADLASRYAYAGREAVCERALEILGATETRRINEHHNASWLEEVAGEKAWVVRKGATPAYPGQEGIVGGSMEYGLVIVEGLDTPDREASLNSTIHGAGRAMSRIKAAGKVKQRKFYRCSHCDYEIKAGNYKQKHTSCPDHGQVKFNRFCREERIREGAVDYDAVKARMAAAGVILRGGAADEAPEAYKRLDDVLAAHENHIKVSGRLRPRGVAMAGPDVYDAHKVD